MKLRLHILPLLLLLVPAAAFTQNYQLSSPDKRISVTILVSDNLVWSARYDGETILLPSRMSMVFGDGKQPGIKPVVTKAIPSSVNSVITAPVPVKNRLIKEEYNELKLQCKGNYTVVFRAYNDGIAYRFITAFADSVYVNNENAEFNFAGNLQTAWPYDEPFSFGSFRSTAVVPAGFGSPNPPQSGMGMFGGPPPTSPRRNNAPGAAPGAPPGAPPGAGPGAGPGGDMPPMPMRMVQNPFTTSYEYLFRDSLIASVKDTVGLPVYFSTGNGLKMVLVEADLHDYPNLFAKGTGGNSVTAVFPPFVLKEGSGFGPMGPPAETANYIARTSGKRNYPWRALVLSADDKGLLENELVYKLSSAPAIPTDWIQPGQVAWEWWHASNLFDVNFKAGINTASYKFYIDFAAKYGIKYILIDAGWSDNPEVDIPEISRYADSKKVGVMLWISWKDLTADMTNILDKFQAWNIKGVKMDYMNRADQQMVNIFEAVARETAKRKMLIDFHGAYKPSGLHRMYPNVVNYEGVKGMEHTKLGSTRITPSHDVTLLFTRMVAGPMDYTPGAMHNTSSGNFRNVATEPMSLGTRAHQAAMYIMYDAPIQMLSDNPVLYMREDNYTKFLTQIPTVWDTTIGVAGKIGQFAVMARKKDNSWFVGAMNDWSTRALDVKTDFLNKGQRFKVTIVADGINAERYASDYVIKTIEITGGDVLKVEMAPGGGWAAIITPR